MAVTAASFRVDFPEFADIVAYPDAVIAYWLAFGALMMLNTDRWGNGSTAAASPPTTPYDMGLELFAAHNLVLQRQAMKSAAKGGTPGVMTGAVSGKTVGPVTQNYDTNAGIVADAGHWNLTTYGVRFIQLAMMMGSGGIQL